MPGISPAGFTVSLTFAGAVPLVGLSVSQLFWLGPAAMVNACAEPSEEEIARVLGAGAAVLANTNKVPPVTWIAAFGCVTTRVTATVVGVNPVAVTLVDRKSTRLNSSHLVISYAVFCL